MTDDLTPPHWHEDNFNPATSESDVIYIGMRKYVADDAITTLRTQLADVRAINEELQAAVAIADDYAHRAEAERAAQIEADAGICDEMHGSIWDYDAHECALAIRAQPHDRTALDAAIRAAKVGALRKAEVATLGLATGHECRAAILALIGEGG